MTKLTDAEDFALCSPERIAADLEQAARDAGPLNPGRQFTRDHGFPILARKPCRDPRDGDIILADRGPDSPHRFVVWHEYPNGCCEGGQYIGGAERAVEAFTERR